MLYPTRGRWLASIDYYFENWSNLYGFMDNNSKLTTEAILTLNRHRFKLGIPTTNPISGDHVFDVSDDNSFYKRRVRTGTLLDWLDIPIDYFGEVSINASDKMEVLQSLHPLEPILTYIDIYRNYYVNNQENRGAIVNGNMRFETDTSHGLTNLSVSLEDLDKCIMSVRNYSAEGDAFTVEFPTDYPSIDAIPNKTQAICGMLLYWSTRFASTGLFLRTYRMDLYRGMLSTSVGSVKSQIVATPDENGNITINFEQIVEANKNFDLINKIDLSGGRWRDNIIARWAVTPREAVDRPVYLGSHRAWIDTTDVVATAAGQSGNADVKNPDSVLGQQSGFGFGFVDAKDQKPIKLFSSDYGTLMAIFSLVPDVVYSQGFPLPMLKTKFADIYDPSFKQLGYSSVSKVELSALPRYIVNERTATNPIESIGIYTNDLNEYSQAVGKRIAFAEYMTAVSRSHGRMAAGQDLEQWVLNRRYRRPSSAELDAGQSENSSIDTSTYINPSDWNGGFVSTDYRAENWRLTVSFDIYAKRPIGKRVTPKL